MNIRKKTKDLSNVNGDVKDWKTMSGKDLYYSFFFIEDPRPLLKRYMPTIASWMLAGCFSIAMMGILVLVTYLDSALEDRTLRNWFFGGLAVSILFSLAQIQVVYGRPHWVWINVGIYFVCLLISLPAITYRPNTYLYSMALLGPLVGLLILNSNRCREMRQKMLEIRHKREAIIATLKEQGKWKWW
ncbi:hypothetical protein ACW9I4_19915 [Pseudomonas sp. SDT2931_S440]|uniref:hypothetical protein n=1 Tax=unclassified Pseudomonas TaxID=196821 RepID=UPI001068466D|nr:MULTISPECIES: hypothetical protein [unclassified Pseudomonas]MDP9032738.1 hypothetical protein [Pseudomonadota bacterium]MDE1908928.1 hypothetical protein [Pseudomonas sp.]MDE2033452.1 hypothetical protein [Pseudomonas sp.]MDE2192840.1 hypothetical protein [Pseudomonas sp.]MDE2557764.1 hypothetical protein [Pseudomonas sp.]